MKIRSGFVSNSSNSSFILIYIPENFNPEIYIDYINEKKSNNKKKKFPTGVVNDLKILIKKGYANQQDDYIDYYELYEAVYPLRVFEGETIEDCGYIEIMNKSMIEKMDRIGVDFNNEKMKIATADIRERRERNKLKHKHIDPFDEEDWDDDENIKDSLKIKTLYDFVNESKKKKKSRSKKITGIRNFGGYGMLFGHHDSSDGCDCGDGGDGGGGGE